MNIERVRIWLGRVWNSYWFLPALFTLAAIVAASLSLRLSVLFDSQLLDVIGIWSVVEPPGARAILATIAGSMITVAGVTFSVATLAVSHATANFGPRLFASFLKDRGSQVTLGTFVATFVFCLITLGAVSDGDGASGFVPHVSLLAAIALSLLSVGVLIFFVNHAQQRLYISNVIADLGQSLNRRIESMFPETLGEGPAAPANWQDLKEHVIRTSRPGYLQNVVDDELLETAEELDCGIELLIAPGEFAVSEQPVARIMAASGEVSESHIEKVRAALIVGDDRTEEQDVYYIVDQLVQVATRALSPGINDPFTANTCVDWLANALARVGCRDEPAGYRRDRDGSVRIAAPAVTYRGFVSHAVDQLLPYLRADGNARRHAARALVNARNQCAEGRELARLLSRPIADLQSASEG